nr:molybdopterin-dependent oxidoreductase [Nocardia bovistercoris]
MTNGGGSVAVGAAALGAAEAVAALGGVSLVDAVARLMADTAPIPVVEATVALTGRHEKRVSRFTAGAGVVALAAAAVAAPSRLRDPAVVVLGVAGAALASRPAYRSGWAAAGAVAAAGVLAAGSRLCPTRGLGMATWASAGLGLLVAARSARRDHERRYEETIRRVGPVGALGLAPEDGFEGEPGLSPLVTAGHRFYVADVNPRPPRVDPDRWRLSITGMVAHPLRLTLTELIVDAVEFDAVMVCVHNRAGQRRVGNARWTGVPLADLLRHAMPESGATRLVTRAVDGYTISLPVPPLRSGELEGYLVVGMNGRPLDPAHGFPARVFVPGLYGQYTGVKWLSELQLTDDSHTDYWWRRGWTPEPIRVQPHARIDAAVAGQAGTVVTGVAWAPPEGVAAVEVSVGQGEWRPTELAAELAPTAWRRWRTTLDLPPGKHTVRARAVANSGRVQSGDRKPPYPSGPSGFHAVTVSV